MSLGVAPGKAFSGVTHRDNVLAASHNLIVNRKPLTYQAIADALDVNKSVVYKCIHGWREYPYASWFELDEDVFDLATTGGRIHYEAERLSKTHPFVSRGDIVKATGFSRKEVAAHIRKLQKRPYWTINVVCDEVKRVSANPNALPRKRSKAPRAVVVTPELLATIRARRRKSQQLPTRQELIAKWFREWKKIHKTQQRWLMEA